MCPCWPPLVLGFDWGLGVEPFSWGDEDSTGLTITYTPYSDSAVIIKVNGLQCNLGNGAKDEACYFSADGGTTARSVADITAGDSLYWMGSIAGYELEVDDDIDIVYDASSNDV